MTRWNSVGGLLLRDLRRILLGKILRRSLRSKPPTEFHRVICPVFARFRDEPSEHPQADALRIEFQELSEPHDGPLRILLEPPFAVHEVLSRVVRGVANERFRVDD